MLPEERRVYRIFSIHTVDPQGDAYRVQFQGEADFETWAEKMARENEAEELKNPDGLLEFRKGADILTLSTCTQDEERRLVVQGARAEGLFTEDPFTEDLFTEDSFTEDSFTEDPER